jgi:hypothetical protein
MQQLLIGFAYDGNASAVILILKKFIPEDNPQNVFTRLYWRNGKQETGSRRQH